MIAVRIAAGIAIGSVAATLCPAVARAAGNPVPVTTLTDIINDNNALITDREEAAVNLINQNTPAATNAAANILRSGNNPRSQSAIARALAQVDNPDPQFIPDLGQMLGENPAMSEAAAKALANYDGHPEVFSLLQKCADNPAYAVNIRAMAIRAMGSQVQQSVASYLIARATAANQSPALTNASMDALADMTGIGTYDDNPQLWQAWWNKLNGANPDQFRSTVLATRDHELRLLKLHNAQLALAAQKDLRENLQKLNSKDAETVLLGYLNDPIPEIRIAGVEQINILYSNPALFVQELRTKLLNMVDDPDPAVRLQVATVLLTVNDKAALPAILKQLDVEKDVRIKAALAKVLGKLEDPSATAALVKMLDDPHPEIVIAAANALSGSLGAALQKSDPKQADQISLHLRKIVDDNANIPGTEELRAACVSALAALRDKLSFQTFMRLVQPGEPSEVRQAALVGLGNLGNVDADSVIADRLDDNDRRVRYRAAEALVTTAEPSIANRIFLKLQNDPDEGVRNMLWNAFQSLYPKMSIDDLVYWASQMKKIDSEKWLVTLQKLGDAYAAKKDDKGVAGNQEDIALAMVTVKPPNYAGAITNLRKALAYWRGPGKGDDTKLEGIIAPLLEDQLKAGQYTEATQFAAQQIALNPEYQQIVGPSIKDEADRLSTTDTASARRLIDAALAMKPPLPDKYIGQLQSIESQLK